jgi:SAM-dependent methyltransferase
MSFTEEDIRQIYNTKVKLPNEYFKKYEILPAIPVSNKRGWVAYDYPRIRCILDFRDWVKKHNLEYVNHLAYTYNEDPELEFVNFIKNTEISFPPYDLHTISNHYKNEFDFFIFNQTLEHLYNPFEAVKQIYTTLKPGGYVFTSVPTLNIPHSTPLHFNGFTPMGLAMLFKTANFDIVEMGQWGNYEYIQKLFQTHSWPNCDDLKMPTGIIKNEERNVCQCWILAKKQ